MFDKTNEKYVNVIASFGSDNQIKIWNVRQRKCVSTMEIDSLIGLIEVDEN